MLLGEEAIDKLCSSRIAVFGAGGVGGYVLEALVRSGVGAIDVIDNDVVAPSNLNRQIIATTKTIGRPKTEVVKERLLEINPDCVVVTHDVFYLPETEGLFDFSAYDYIVDAVDTVAAKISLIVNAKKAGVPVISSMGAGNKLDPTAFKVADIYDTRVCPLAKVMRKELSARGVENPKVVYSEEPPLKPFGETCALFKQPSSKRRATPGSVAFVPSVVGLIIASEVVKDIINK